MVRRSTYFDVLTVIFGATSPVLTTYVAFSGDIGQMKSTIKLILILVVTIAVILPALKSIFGIRKRAIHTSASAMELYNAVTDAYQEMGRIVEDIQPEKKDKYLSSLRQKLNSKVSEAKQNYNRLTFDIMEESHGIAKERAKIAEEKLNKFNG